MKAAEWIDRVKVARGWTSDYQAAKELGLHRNTISTYRARGTTLEEDTAIKIAGALGEQPAAVLLDQYAERAKNPEVRAALNDAARRLCILCKTASAIVCIALAPKHATLNH